MKNRKEKTPRIKKDTKYFDMYAIKEHPLAQLKRISGERYEKDHYPLRPPIANLASDTDRKARGLVTAIYNSGFTFDIINDRDYRIVAL